MKKDFIYIILFISISSIFILNHVYASTPFENKIIVIDAGHGGVDPGTIAGKVYEKDINLKISVLLGNKLKKMGAKVIYTREGDYDLGTPNAYRRKKSDFDHRILLINHSQANYYLSIHLNYLSNSSYYGPQVFYSKVNDQNIYLAEIIQNTLNSHLSTHREIKNISSTIYMYQRLKVPGVLIECGFLSNSKEKNLLLEDSYLNKFTDYLIEALIKI